MDHQRWVKLCCRYWGYICFVKSPGRHVGYILVDEKEKERRKKCRIQSQVDLNDMKKNRVREHKSVRSTSLCKEVKKDFCDKTA